MPDNPDIETDPTQTPVPSPTAVAEADATPEEGAAPSDGTAAGGGTDPAPTVEDGAPAPPAFTLEDVDTLDPYEVADSPKVQEVYQRRRAEERQEEVAHYQGLLEQGTKNWEATELHRTAAGHFGSILEKLDESDTEGADRLLAKVDRLLEPYRPIFEDNVKAGALQSASKHFMGVLLQGLSGKERDDLKDFAKTQQSWEAVVKRRDEMVAAKAKGKQAETDTKLASTREAAEDRALQRDGGKPPVKPAGGGTTAKKHKDMTPEEEAALTPVERDAMTSEFMKQHP